MTWGWGPRPDGVIGDYSTSLTDVNFNWQGRGEEDAHLGGAKGTPAESKVAHAWPTYEAEYLHKRLIDGSGKYLQDPRMPTDRESVYLSKIADDYKKEADEALHTEFVSWLNGSHEENREPKGYVNGPGKPVRRYTDRHSIPDGSVRTIGDEWEESAKPWQATWWGETSLTHLPGVREYLRQMKTKGMEADLQMNLLAEHGPQDLNQAWMYFKHWVKGRPVHENEGKGVQAVNLPPDEGEEPVWDWDGNQLSGRPSKGIDRRSAFGWQPPSGDGPPGSFGQSVHPELDGRVSKDPKDSQDNRDELNEPSPGVKQMSYAQNVLNERTGELINAVNTQGVANSALQRDSLAAQERTSQRALLGLRQSRAYQEVNNASLIGLTTQIEQLARSLPNSVNLQSPGLLQGPPESPAAVPTASTIVPTQSPDLFTPPPFQLGSLTPIGEEVVIQPRTDRYVEPFISSTQLQGPDTVQRPNLQLQSQPSPFQRFSSQVSDWIGSQTFEPET